MIRSAVLALCVLPGLAAAQSPGAPTLAFDRQIAQIEFLQFKEVKEELKITSSQRDRMNKAAESYNALAKMIEPKLARGERPTKAEQDGMDREYRRMREAVLAVLTPVQTRRLREITLQDTGLMALTSPIIARRLSLSAAQTKSVEKILKDSLEDAQHISEGVNRKVRREFANRKPKNDAEERQLRADIEKRLRAEMERVRPQLEKIQSEGRAKIFKTLSQRQRDGWNALLGKPFIGRE